MKTFKNRVWLLLGTIIFGFAILATSCASKRNLWGSEKTGLILYYNLPADEKVSYQKLSAFSESMDINGNNIEVNADQEIYYSMNSMERKDKEYGVEVAIDSMYYGIQTARGEINPVLDGVVGKTFLMGLTDLGKEKDLDYAKSLKYDVAGQETSIASSFMGLFPDLPDHPVMVGDSWNTVDSIVEENEIGNLLMIFNNFNTLVALEVKGGLDCIKVDTKVTGIMKGGGKKEDVLYSFDGTIEGSETWYFAYKEGLLVSESGEGIGKGEIIIPAQNMTIPSTRSFKIEHGLVR